MFAVRDDTTLDQAVETPKFLGDRNHLRTLSALTRTEICACDLIDEPALRQPLVSSHLRGLRNAGLVRARRDARRIYYLLEPAAWERATAPLSGLFGAINLPPKGAYRASHRCDLVPPDPSHGACRGRGGDCV